MTKIMKLNWRLSKLPTPEELGQLVKDKIITQEEAHEVLFSSEEVEDRDKKSLESEIKFLREIIDKLANRSQIITTVREIIPSYGTYTWVKPYNYYCTTTGGNYSTSATNTIGGTQINNLLNAVTKSFSDIVTW